MHSKIIQLDVMPVPTEEYITPAELAESERWFMNEIADYVQHEVDRAGTLLDFIDDDLMRGDTDVTRFADEHGEGIIFGEGFRRAYLERRYGMFEYALYEFIKRLTPENFIDGTIGGSFYNMYSAFRDKFGTYIWFDNMLVELDYFIRYEMKPGVYYCFGAVLDYHY